MIEIAKARPLPEPKPSADPRAYPDRPWVGVGVVVWRGDEFLLIQRGKPPRLGEWSIPGGGQELGETVRDTAMREVREETGVEIAVGGLIDVVDSVRRDAQGRVAFHITLVDFAARWVSGEAVPGDDAMGVGWFRLDDLPKLGLWAETVRVIRESQSLVPL